MPRVSAKRQITLPVDQCREVGIGPGDEFRSFVADGRITIVRMTPGAATTACTHLAFEGLFWLWVCFSSVFRFIAFWCIRAVSRGV